MTPQVYIVDDHDAVRDSLEILLSSAGLEVSGFASGTEFLRSVDPRDSGCLLLDVRLPDMNGIEVQERLRAIGCRLRTIMISGHGDVPLAVRAMKAGAIDFIEKPYTDEVILTRVRETLESGAADRSSSTPEPELSSRLDRLTPREREVLEALVSGQPNKVIAYDLGISPRTVEIHRARVMSKMEAKSLSHLVRMALAAGVETDIA